MKNHKDKGVAGLTILLSVIVMLFIIGLLVMIFSLMSGEMANTDDLYYRTSAITVGQEAISLTPAGTQVANAGKRSAVCSLVAIYNATTLLANGNVTEVSECTFGNNSYYSTWRINYTYTYLADSSGTVDVINDTAVAIGGVTSWFDIFIVITAMVVLIFLTVIIISAIRGSGLINTGTMTNGANKVGTA